MILVTGAAGKTGQAVLAELAERGQPGRAYVRRSSYQERALAAGAADTSVGNLLDREALAQALAGVRAVYHIPPNMHPDELDIGRAVLGAAAEHGVEHFVYHSVLHPQIQAMPHHWRKLQVEEQVLESGLAFTILQPAAYMQYTVAAWDEVIERGVYEVPYPVETRLALVDLADVGRAAAAALSERGHRGAIYELVGEPGLSMQDVAEHMSAALGRSVRAEQIPLERWATSARADGMRADRVEDFLAMFRHYAQHGFPGNANALSGLLGEPPRTYSDFVREHVHGQTREAS